MKMQAIRIIIADDHQQVRQTWKMILQTFEDITIIGECISGQDTIEQAQKLNPDVILMDINMSPVNGFEATRKIVKSQPHIHIIGISINNQPAYARNMIQLGAKGYVTKNSSKEEMIQAIRQVMEGKTFICKEVMDQMGKSR
jgi:two-component system invasion response regulator UvrY